jgi:hypothetical protein
VDWPGVAISAEAMWRRDPRPFEQVVDAWVRHTFGDHARALTEVVLTLGRVAPSFDWGGAVFRSGDWLQFYRPFESGPLAPEAEQAVEAMAAGLAAARRSFDDLAPAVNANADLLEAIDLALNQSVLLCDLTLARHRPEAADTAALAQRVGAWRAQLAAVWHARNKPLALAPMDGRLAQLQASLTKVG